ncbi:hypothetical protein TCON_0559 [Astathelohania contejeani]|uniref:Uncharacterized protein n=1 Tax=Astathelohania contejeani TaxID=164912 RepID=A0ABQ7I1B9_9MICR|nr:hypothetical protein TCON_0559 [Thelohania contejeani]
MILTPSESEGIRKEQISYLKDGTIMGIIEELPKYDIESRYDALTYLARSFEPHPELLSLVEETLISRLLDLYKEIPQLGMVLRKLIKTPEFAEMLFKLEAPEKLIFLMDSDNFLLSGDVYLTLKDLLKADLIRTRTYVLEGRNVIRLLTGLASIYYSDDRKFYKEYTKKDGELICQYGNISGNSLFIKQDGIYAMVEKRPMEKNQYVLARYVINIFNEIINDELIKEAYLSDPGNFNMLIQLYTTNNGGIENLSLHIFKLFISESKGVIREEIIRNRNTIINYIRNLKIKVEEREYLISLVDQIR